MDLRDFVRGFFGLSTTQRQMHPWGQDRRPQGEPSSVTEESETHHNPQGARRRPGFLFGDMFAVMEDMFKEMEQTMKDMDQIFNDLEFNDMDKFLPPSNLPPGLGFDKGTDTIDTELPSLPSITTSENENIRSLVLKDDWQPSKISDKVDKDLDELYDSSKINLSDLLIPRNNSDADSRTERFTPDQRKSSYERVYSTYSFNNGAWEGKTIKEDDRGKEVTTYYRNENGEINQTTEFFEQSKTITPAPDSSVNRNIKPFELFERFFKPRL